MLESSHFQIKCQVFFRKRNNFTEREKNFSATIQHQIEQGSFIMRIKVWIKNFINEANKFIPVTFQLTVYFQLCNDSLSIPAKLMFLNELLSGLKDRGKRF